MKDIIKIAVIGAIIGVEYLAVHVVDLAIQEAENEYKMKAKKEALKKSMDDLEKLLKFTEKPKCEDKVPET